MWNKASFFRSSAKNGQVCRKSKRDLGKCAEYFSVLHFQVHNKTFDTYVNVDENTLLEENAIIRVMDVTIIAEAGTSASVTDP